MKQDIHPTYYKEAKVRCACGNAFMIGSTKPNIEVEICGKCHPFYTGRQQLVDTAGRAERFTSRRAKAKPEAVSKKKEKKTTRTQNKKPKVIELEPKTPKPKRK